jgi:4-alpha-glucanotransferase
VTRGGDLLAERHAGVLVPLFSIPSARSWGIGEIPDLVPLAAWLRHAGQDLLQILPVQEIGDSEQSPYSAITAMAIDPTYIALEHVEEFKAFGGEQALSARSRDELATVRASRRVDYARVRALKGAALRAVFERFVDVEWRGRTARADALRAYVEQQAWWLDDYALFRALRARFEDASWRAWPQPLRDRDAGALGDARSALGRDILLHQYVQWIAETQWHAARAAADGVAILGDLPFMVGDDSADVWARQELFDLNATIGTPPDAFSETGQDWGLPAYRWDRVAATDFAWLRDRGRRGANFYDGYRVDHVVGFYRTYVRPRDGRAPYFSPDAEEAQRAQGERIITVFRESGAVIVAEDLGTVPDFVRESLARLKVPGYSVLRWERRWHEPAQPFKDPAAWPPLSVATSGTHDTEPLAAWWEQAPTAERQLLRAIPSLSHLSEEEARGPCTPSIRDALLQALFGAGSRLLILPIQDVFGWTDRINTPASASSENWTYRLPWAADSLGVVPEALERAAALREWAERYKRGAL